MHKTGIKLLEKYEEHLLGSGARKKGLIITVSGLSGSGKSSVVSMLMEAFPKLELVYPGGIFRENAKRLGMALEEYAKTRKKEDDIDIDREVLKRSLPGNAIVDTRLAAWTLGGWADCRIFVACPLAARSERVSAREGITVKEARRRLEERDSADSAVYKSLYGIDVSDMRIYDFVVDNSGSLDGLKKNVGKIVEKIKNIEKGM